MRVSLSELADIAAECVTAKEAAAFYGLEINRNGFASCPFHSEKTPSFHVGEKVLYCFGCGWKGGLIRFVRDYLNLSFPDALRRVNEDFRLNLPLDRSYTAKESAVLDTRRREMQRREQEQKRKEEEYHAALDEYIACDRLKRELAPASPEQDYDELYVFAVKYLDVASERLSRIEAERVREWSAEHGLD